MSPRSRLVALALGAAATVAFVPACSSSTDTSTGGGTTAATSAPAKASVAVANAWSRTSPANAANGVVYLDLTATTDDALLSASVLASVAGKAELHETVTDGTMPGSTTMSTVREMAGEGAGAGAMGDEMPGATAPGTSMAGSGMMTMQPVERILLPAGTTVQLKPGGYHIMLLGLVQPLKVGDEVEVTLTFEKAQPQTVKVPVKEM